MNRETKLGLSIVGGIVVMLGVLAYGAFVLFTQTIPYLNRAASPQSGGGGYADTNLYVEGPFVRDYAAAATMELPPVPRQPDSPSVQLGFFRPGFNIQGGLIRAPYDNFHLRAFVAYASPGHVQNRIRYFGRLKDGPHTVEIRVRDGKITFLVDGRPLFSAPQSAYAPQDGNPWLTFGTAVKYRGSSAYGSIFNIRVRRDGDESLAPYDPVCVGSSGGIRILRYGDMYEMTGAYTGGRAAYRGCSEVFARHRALAAKTT